MIRVLFIDSQSDPAEQGKRHLGLPKDIKVDTALSASIARNMLDHGDYHAIVSDYQLPEMTSIDFLRELRSKGDTIPFILFTQRGREEVVIEALNAGVDFYVQKGGDQAAQYAELEHKVRQVVRQRQAEASLQQREERLRSILATVPDTIITVDPALRILNINHHVDPAVDAIGRSVLDSVDPKFHDLVRAEFERVFRKGENGHYEALGPDPSGELIWYETNIGPVFEGGAVKGAVLITRAINDRKQAEMVLRESEERFRCLAENAFEGIAISSKGILIDTNGAMQRILGYKEDELTGRLMFDFFTPESAETVKEKLKKPEAAPYEAQLIDSGGRIHTVLIHGKDVTWKGRPARLGAVQDISELSEEIAERKWVEEVLARRNEELNSVVESLAATQEEIRSINADLERRVAERTAQLEEANLHLQDLDRLKSLFIASMSHELRTPLNSIIGFTGILLKGLAGDINDEQRKQLKMVQESSRLLLALINDVIDISKVEAGMIDISATDFDLGKTVRDVLGHFAPSAADKGILMRYSGPKALLVTSDDRRVKQVINNLCSNAVKFTDSGEIAITLTDMEDRAEVSVQDTGIGISSEDLAGLFQPFHRLHTPDRLVDGTGLGLYLSRKLAVLLGGDIRAESELGKGSRFTFSLATGKDKEEAHG